jgi:hypothetical protein
VAHIIDMSSAQYMRGEYRLRTLGKYGDGSVALELAKPGDDCDTCMVTVSLAGYGMIPPEGHVYIKNYSENEGILPPLLKAGIFEVVEMVQPNGSFARFPLCKILVDLDTL